MTRSTLRPTSREFRNDPNKSPAIALFLFVGYILSFVIRFIVNAPDSLLIKHELDLEEFEHQGTSDILLGYDRVQTRIRKIGPFRKEMPTKAISHILIKYDI